MPVKTGTYIGDGAATQAIVGVGFTPRILAITAMVDGGAGSDDCFSRIPSDVDGCFQWTSLLTMPRTDTIISLDADGFTVGDSHAFVNVMNINLRSYSYVCWS